MRDSGPRLLEEAAATRTLLDALLSRLAQAESEEPAQNGDDSSSVVSGTSFLSAASSARVRTSVLVKRTSGERTVFIPLRVRPAGDPADQAAGLSAGSDGWHTQDGGDGGAVELDVAAVGRGLAGCASVAEVEAILGSWIFPRNPEGVDGRGAAKDGGEEAVARYGRCLPLGDTLSDSPQLKEALAAPLRLPVRTLMSADSGAKQGGRRTTLVMVQGSAMHCHAPSQEEERVDPLLVAHAARALASVEPGLLAPANGTPRTHTESAIAQARSTLAAGVEAALVRAASPPLARAALAAVASLCINPAILAAFPDPDLFLPSSVTADVGSHGPSAGYGAALTVAVPFVFLLRPADATAGGSASVGRIVVVLALRVAFSGHGGPGMPPRVCSGVCELTWHPGDEGRTAKEVILGMPRAPMVALLRGPPVPRRMTAAELKEEEAVQGQRTPTVGGAIRQVLHDARRVARRIPFAQAIYDRLGGGMTAEPVAAPPSAAQVAKESLRALHGGRTRGPFRPSSEALIEAMLAPPGSTSGGEDMDGWDWSGSELDPRSLTPVMRDGSTPVGTGIVALLDAVSTGAGGMHQSPGGGGAGGSSAFAPRPLAGPGVALSGGTWASSLPRASAPIGEGVAEEGDPSSSLRWSLPTAYTRLWAWGGAEHGALGLGADAGKGVRLPTPIPFAGELGGWRVVSIACGWHHTVALTDSGSVYSWGSGADGQLGHGEESMAIDCPTPRLLDFFGLVHPLRVTAVAAGSDASGCHTVVIATGLMLDEVAADGEETAKKGAAKLGDGLLSATNEGEEAQPGDDEDTTGAPGVSLPPAGRDGTAIAHLGRVFAWGVGVGAGQPLSTAPVPEPRLVKSGASDMYMPGGGGVHAIAAGGGFTVALTRAGGVYSWGKYASGRLGLGAPPETRHSGRGSGEKRFLRHSLSPLRITKGWSWRDAHNANPPPADEAASALASAHAVGAVPNLYGPPTVPVRAIAAGEAHGLAVDVWGLAWGWGRGAAGATGMGVAGDALVPHRITATVPVGDPAAGLSAMGAGEEGEGGSVRRASSESTRGGQPRPVRFVRVCAGVAHSLAIDVVGGLWNWGGGGGDMLGHADGAKKSGGGGNLPTSLGARVRASQVRGSARKVQEEEEEEEGEEEEEEDGEELLPPPPSVRQPWLLPRRVPSLDGSRSDRAVVAAGGGAAHSWAITLPGALLVWGAEGAGTGVLGRPGGGAESAPRLVGTGGGGGGESDALPLLGTLACETVTAVGSGAWHTIAATPLGGTALGSGLRAAWSLAPAFNQQVGDGGSTLGDGTASVLSIPASTAALSRSPVRGFDVVLVTDGGRAEFLAHAAILSARVPGLGAEITRSIDAGGRSRAGVTRLLLPRFGRWDVARLLEWAYTGGVALPLDVGGGGGRADPAPLADLAQELGVPDLAALATIHAQAPLRYWLRGGERQAGGEDEEGEAAMLVPPSARVAQGSAARTLASDRAVSSLGLDLLALLLGELEPAPAPSARGLTPHADLLLIVSVGGGGSQTPRSSWALPAHVCIVACASEYLRALLCGPGEGGASEAMGSGPVTELVLPDSPLTVARLLLAMYTGVLPALPHSYASASEAEQGPTPGIALPWRRLRVALPEAVEEGEGEETVESEEEEEEGEEGVAGSSRFEAWGGRAYAVPPTLQPWSPGGQMLDDARAAARYGLPRILSLIDASLEVAAPSAGPSHLGRHFTQPAVLTPAQALEASGRMDLPRLKQAGGVAALGDLATTLADPSWAGNLTAGQHADLLAGLMDDALAANDGFFGVLAAEAAKPAPSGKEGRGEEEEGRSGSSPLAALAALAALFLAFLALAQYNTGLAPSLPYINAAVLLSAAVMAYYGILTT